MSADPETPEFAAALERAKIAAIYNLAYGLSHEFNNPLANIASRAQALLADEEDPERRRKLAAIVAQAFRAHEMIADLMLFAKPPQLERQPLALDELMAQACSELASQAAEKQAELLITASKNIVVSADRAALLEAIKAVIKNALEAVGSAGRVTLALEATDQEAIIIIADNGPGIPAEIRPFIFDPYFSGREAGRGLGLGLCKCWRILDQHGGRVEVASGAGEGSAFRLILLRDKPAQ